MLSTRAITIVASMPLIQESEKEIQLCNFKIICDFQEHQQNKTFYLTPKLNILSEHVKSARLNNSKIDFIIL